jgi:hypothetical protein
MTIIECADNADMLLHKLYAITPHNSPKELEKSRSTFESLSQQDYTLVLFIFKKGMPSPAKMPR